MVQMSCLIAMLLDNCVPKWWRSREDFQAVVRYSRWSVYWCGQICRQL